jgi:hypothetical protein
MFEEPTGALQGDEARGFRLQAAFGGRRLVVECWGYWEPETSALFSRLSLRALEKVVPPLDFTLDASLLKPQSSGGQEALRVFLKGLAAKHLECIKVRVSDVLTRMQLTRLMRESGLPSPEFSNPSSDAPPARKS